MDMSLTGMLIGKAKAYQQFEYFLYDFLGNIKKKGKTFEGSLFESNDLKVFAVIGEDEIKIVQKDEKSESTVFTKTGLKMNQTIELLNNRPIVSVEYFNKLNELKGVIFVNAKPWLRLQRDSNEMTEFLKSNQQNASADEVVLQLNHKSTLFIRSICDVLDCEYFKSFWHVSSCVDACNSYYSTFEYSVKSKRKKSVDSENTEEVPVENAQEVKTSGIVTISLIDDFYCIVLTKENGREYIHGESKLFNSSFVLQAKAIANKFNASFKLEEVEYFKIEGLLPVSIGGYASKDDAVKFSGQQSVYTKKELETLLANLEGLFV